MRKSFSKVILVALVATLVASLGLVGCGKAADNSSNTADGTTPAATSGAISVVSREDGSGTRGAFTELVGVLDDKKKDATTDDAVVTNSTAVMITTVSGDPKSVGYVSMGSLNDTVKALEIDGVAATTANVKNGTYKIARPFNVAQKGNLSPQAEDFLSFIMSKEGQKAIVEKGFIAVNDSAPDYKSNGASGKVVVAGSSSVTPAMEKIIEAYKKANANVTVELQTSDSSTGVKNVVDGVCDLGMASRELKDSELAKGITPTKIAMDGIAVIVHKDSSIKGLTVDQVKEIFLGNTTKWEDVAK